MKLEDLQSLKAIKGRQSRALEMITLIQAEIDQGKAQIEGYRAEVAALEDRKREIIQEIAKLPELQRNAALLHFDAGMPWSEVAAALHVSLRHVYRIGDAILDQ